MILCANNNVSGFLLLMEEAELARTSAEEGLLVFVLEEDGWECKAAICADTESALSSDMPSVISAVPPPGMREFSSASISISVDPPAMVFCEEVEDDSPEILNTALSLPGPIPPRNLNVGGGGWEGGGALLRGAGRAM